MTTHDYDRTTDYDEDRVDDDTEVLMTEDQEQDTDVEDDSTEPELLDTDDDTDVIDDEDDQPETLDADDDSTEPELLDADDDTEDEDAEHETLETADDEIESEYDRSDDAAVDYAAEPETLETVETDTETDTETEPELAEDAPPATAFERLEPVGPDTPIDPGTGSYTERWGAIQTGFIDDPQRAVEGASSLLVEMWEQVERAIAAERESVDGRWRDAERSTDELRTVMQEYRALYTRLTSFTA